MPCRDLRGGGEEVYGMSEDAGKGEGVKRGRKEKRGRERGEEG